MKPVEYSAEDLIADREWQQQHDLQKGKGACSHWAPVPGDELPHVKVTREMNKRLKKGLEKYGKPCIPHDGQDYLQHLKEELMDAIVYIQTLQDEKKKNGS